MADKPNDIADSSKKVINMSQEKIADGPNHNADDSKFDAAIDETRRHIHNMDEKQNAPPAWMEGLREETAIAVYTALDNAEREDDALVEAQVDAILQAFARAHDARLGELLAALPYRLEPDHTATAQATIIHNAAIGEVAALIRRYRLGGTE